MKNTDFMNLSLPEGSDKIDVEILNNDFKKLENEASKHYIKQQIEVDGTATIIGSIGPYVQLENLTDNILNVSIGDELIVLMNGDNRKIRTVSGENYGVVTSGAVRITYYINAQTYADENFYKKEKVDELLQNVEATVEVDAELSETSENPVQNKVITAEFANYATTAEVENKVTEKVAEIVAGAPEDFDTLKEMSDWLLEHEDSAASMNSAIQKNAEDIETANENIEKKLDKKAICVNGADYNSFVETGFYEALGNAGTPTKNSPSGNDTSNNFYVIVQQRGASYVSQFAISARNDTGVYVRTMSNSTWSAWRKLLDNTTKYALSDSADGAALSVKTVTAGSNEEKLVLFSGLTTAGDANACVDENYKYNPSTNTLTVPNIESDTTVAMNTAIQQNKTDIATASTRISALETLSDAVYKHNKSSYCTIDGYVLRVGNQVHLNLTATFSTACGEWYGGVIDLPFNTKTPDNSTRYTIKQTQSDGRETSIYLQMGSTSFYSSTAFKKGDVITIPPMILDMYVEETTTTEGGE